MTYKLLALDMDDTLLSEDLSISQKNIEAIKAMEANGVRIILVSGRPYESMVKYLDVLDIHSDDDYIVSFNGALINKISGELVFRGTVQGKVLDDLILKGREKSIDVQLYSPLLTVEKHTDKTARYEYLTGMKAKVIEDLRVIDDSVKVLFNHVAGPDLEALRLELEDKYGKDFNIFYSKPNYIEFLNKKSSKGLAVKFLAEGYGIEQSEVVAVGDGFNDVSMIDYAGLGVAVANAPDGVKEVADYVTTADHNNDAIWEVYQKFFS